MKATEKMIGDVPGNVLGMLADLNLKLKKQVLTPKQLEMFLKKKNPFLSQNEILADWKKFYSGLKIKCNLSKVIIPDDPGDFERIIIVAQEVAPQWIYDKCKNLFKCWKWTDKNLDGMVISDRDAKNGSYATRVRDRIEADEELKNLSANDIKKEKIVTETLEERLIHELKFFQETGKHLDIKNITLCSGSRLSDGGAPYIRWREDEFFVGLQMDWYYSHVALGNLRARQAVS